MKRKLALAILSLAMSIALPRPDAHAQQSFLTYKQTWNAGATYSLNDMVVFSGSTYISTGNLNTANSPASNPGWWTQLSGGSGGGNPGGTTTGAMQYRTSLGAFGGDDSIKTDGSGNLTAKSFGSTDTVNNPQDMLAPGSSGDSTCILNATTGYISECFLAGYWSVSRGSSGAYNPYLSAEMLLGDSTISITPATVSGVKTYTLHVTSAGSAVANTTITVGTTAITANSCTTASTAAMTGVTTSMVLNLTPTTDVSSVTGWSSAGPTLYFVAWPTAGTLNYKVCNGSASSITPSASTTWNVGAR